MGWFWWPAKSIEWSKSIEIILIYICLILWFWVEYILWRFGFILSKSPKILHCSWFFWRWHVFAWYRSKRIFCVESVIWAVCLRIQSDIFLRSKGISSFKSKACWYLRLLLVGLHREWVFVKMIARLNFELIRILILNFLCSFFVNKCWRFFLIISFFQFLLELH